LSTIVGWVRCITVRGCWVEEPQGGGVDVDADAASGEDFRGEQLVVTGGDQAFLGDGAIDFQGGTGLGRSRSEGPAGPPVPTRAASLVVDMRGERFRPGPAVLREMTLLR
jgi:hypothetical protein